MQNRSNIATLLARFARGGELRSLALQVLTATGVLIIAALILMGITVSNLIESRRQGETLQDTMLEVTTVETRMLDAEGALNGYAVTASPSYQKRIADNNVILLDTLNKLQHSVEDDPRLAQMYEATLVMNRQRMAILAGMDAPEHRAEIGARVLQAKPLSDRIRGNIWSILENHRAMQRQNNAKLVGQARQSYWVAATIVVLTFVFGALSLVLSIPTAEKRTNSGK